MRSYPMGGVVQGTKTWGIRRLQDFFLVDIWRWESTGRSPGAVVVQLLQLAVAIVQGFIRNRLLLRASALTYVTLLSLIPLLAIGLLIVHVIGYQEDLAGIIIEKIAAGSPEAIEPLKKMIPQVEFAKLGSLGAAVAFCTTLLAVGNAELAFNDIWGVRRRRPIGRRFTDYLAVVVVAPLALGVSISLGAAIQENEVTRGMLEYSVIAWTYGKVLMLAPICFATLGFACFYWFLPNTHVRFASALLGGAVAAVLTSIAQDLYVDFNFGIARYSAVYGGLALLPLLFVWIYLVWSIVLLGGQVAYAHQNMGRYRLEVWHPTPDPTEREAIGLAVALEIAGAFREGTGAWTPERLCEELKVSVRVVRDVLSQLERAGIVTACATQRTETSFQLGRSADGIPVADVLIALRGVRGDAPSRGTGAVAWDLLAELEEGEAEALDERSLADVLEFLSSDALEKPEAEVDPVDEGR